MIDLPWLKEDQISFPPAEQALQEPDGLLAAGGDLSPQRLIQAYRQGIFPWYEEGQPILWWSPNPRAVLYPDKLYISRSLQKILRKNTFHITADKAFADVITQCASPRATSDETWITEDMVKAYIKMHQLGWAHSVEVWQDDKLVGGLYGLAMGKLFFGESMFSLVSNASKVAFVHLVKQLQDWGYELVDCQLPNQHLARFGTELIERDEFLRFLRLYLDSPGLVAPWQLNWQYS